MADEPLVFPRVNGIKSVSVTRMTCGDCAYYKPMGSDFKQGTCHGNPPVVAFDERGPIAMRPAVQCDDPACRVFKKY
jgi:hypothetical protein